jgi:hypothetical protein
MLNSKPNLVLIHVVRIALAMSISIAAVASAQVPQDTSFSGRLVDSGVPIVGPVDFDLLVYDADTAGTVLYSERHTSVPLESDGSFSVLLGGGSVLVGTFDAALFNDPERYIEVALLSPVVATLIPRVPVTSAPWALVAETVLNQPGNVTVSGLAFTDELGGSFLCYDNKSSGAYFSFRGTGTECDADAPIQLPDGATLTTMSCTIYDNNPTEAVTVALRRVNMNNGGSADVFLTPPSATTASIDPYVDLAPFPGTSIVDNVTYAYSLRADFGLGLPTATLRLYGCRVEYE